MTEASTRKPRSSSASQRRKPEPSVRRPASGDDAERSLGRAVALGLPLITVAAALGVGLLAGLGSGLLVLASGALLGTIALLWASVRTLSGDAPLQTGFQTVTAGRLGVDALGEEKRRVLRQLKDLEAEHALGKIDDADYESLVARYRSEAKNVMREMDREIGPLRAEAERIAREYLSKRGLTDGAPAPETHSEEEPARAPCAKCGTSNESDAAFCKKCGAAMRTAAESADDGAGEGRSAGG